MGEEIFRQAGWEAVVIGQLETEETSGWHTQQFAAMMLEKKVDLLLFVGGDGTARDVLQAVDKKVTVVGIPSGVKMHSAVFAGNLQRGAHLLRYFTQHENMKVREVEVADLDEEAYRKGNIQVRLFGYLNVPEDAINMRGGKVQSRASDAYYQQSIARELFRRLEKNVSYIVGPGSTTAVFKKQLSPDYSLLGFDLFKNGKLIKSDANESDILYFLSLHRSRLILTPIGGQGILLGRGNQQISPDVITKMGKDNIIIIATPQKIHDLQSNPLLVDTDDPALNKQLSGYYRIITGFKEEIVYRVSD